MNKKDRGAVELTVFHLKRGFELNDFIKVNHDIDVWMKKQKGFRSRRMFEGSEGKIYDLIFWNREEDGRLAMSRLMEEFPDSEVHAMINQKSVDWFVSSVGHALLK